MTLLVVTLKTQPKTSTITIPTLQISPPSKKCLKIWLALPEGAFTTYPHKLRPKNLIFAQGVHMHQVHPLATPMHSPYDNLLGGEVKQKVLIIFPESPNNSREMKLYTLFILCEADLLSCAVRRPSVQHRNLPVVQTRTAPTMPAAFQHVHLQTTPSAHDATNSCIQPRLCHKKWYSNHSHIQAHNTF